MERAITASHLPACRTFHMCCAHTCRLSPPKYSASHLRSSNDWWVQWTCMFADRNKPTHMHINLHMLSLLVFYQSSYAPFVPSLVPVLVTGSEENMVEYTVSYKLRILAVCMLTVWGLLTATTAVWKYKNNKNYTHTVVCCCAVLKIEWSFSISRLTEGAR